MAFFLYEFNTKRRKTVLNYVRNKLSKNPDALALMERFQSDAQEGFTILQIGETGVGKSSTINSLFGFLQNNPLMQRFFDVFLFEGVPASDHLPDALYLDKVKQSDLYVGLFGNDYGFEDVDGISPTDVLLFVLYTSQNFACRC